MRLKRELAIPAILIIVLLMSSITVPSKGLVEDNKAVFVYIQPIPKPPAHFNRYVPRPALPSLPLVLEPLAYFNRENDTWIPWLAESWELSEDGLTLTVHLRKGVKWSDGTDFTSKDIEATWYCGRLIKWGQWNYIDELEVVDDYTVIFHLKKPWIFTEYNILRTDVSSYSVYGNFSDAAKEAFAEGDADRITALAANLTAFRPTKAVGTGPFEFVTLTASEMLFKKRDEYWHGIDKIKFDYYKQLHLGSGPSEFAGIISYQCDLSSPDLTREAYQMIKALGNIYVPAYSWYHGQSLIFNFHRYPLSLKEVRQAFAYAINRTELCIAVSPDPKFAFPTEYPCGLTIGDFNKWVNPDFLKYFNKYEYNPDKAIEIFESLNFTRGSDGIWVTPNGTRLEFDLTSPPWTDWALSCENIKAQLEKVGVKINVYATEPVVCVLVPAGDFDLGLHCFLRNFGNLPIPYQNFADRSFGSPTWSAGVGTYNKLFEVPEYGLVNATDWFLKIVTTLHPEKQK